MSLKDYIFPCVQILHYVEAKNGLRIAICNTNNEAEELCSILNAHFEPKEEAAPQPNRKETDAIAAKYYESGRKLEVQFWDSKQWTQGDWEGEGRFTPTFDYSLPWRIKPTKRRVVVDVFTLENSQPFIFSESGSDGAKSFRSDKACKFVGTIEGEVEG